VNLLGYNNHRISYLEFAMNYKINFLHLVQTLGCGGAENLLIHYIRSLGSTKYNHYVYCFGKDLYLKETLEDLKVEVKIGPSRKSLKNPLKFILWISKLFIDLYNYTKNKKIHIIQSHLFNGNQVGYFLGLITKIPILLTVHSTKSFSDYRKKIEPRIYLLKIVNTIVYKNAEKIVAISPEIKKILIKKYKLNSSNIIVLKNGIYLDKKILKKEKKRIELKGRIKILAVGSLRYEKSFSTLIQATKILVTDLKVNVLVMIAGEGIEREKLKKLIYKYNLSKNIILLGLRNDIYDLMNKSDIYVSTSLYEGLSIAMIEAFAHNLPVIASDVPGINTVIKNNVNGLLFPVDNYKILSEKIALIINDETLRERLSKNAGIDYHNNYNMKKNINILEKYIYYKKLGK
jgi:glycosyltransferase involved in cell wall biosynthesis